MKIAVNARLLQKNKLEGIGTFMDEVLKRITQNHPEIEFHFIFDRQYDASFIYGNNVIPHVVSPPTKHVLIFDFWFNFQVPRIIKKVKANYFLSLDGITSTNLNVPSHVVVHDINFAHRPQDLPKAPRKYYLKKAEKFCHYATQLATVSEYSKKDISNSYEINKEKIDVVYNAAKAGFQILNDSEISSIKKQYSENKDYFLYVGSLHPRKNLNNLIAGFDQFKSKTGSPKKLLIVGNIMWESQGLKEILDKCQHKNDIVFTGRKSDEDLQKIMGAAFALSYIPYFEGFGIPIVEAYACAVPVITSNTTCMPEIAQNGALYASPDNVSEIANAMDELENEEGLRDNLITNGLDIVKKYSWDRTAQLYWESVQKIMAKQ